MFIQLKSKFNTVSLNLLGIECHQTTKKFEVITHSGRTVERYVKIYKLLLMFRVIWYFQVTLFMALLWL